jgi:hypothetical protein
MTSDGSARDRNNHQHKMKMAASLAAFNFHYTYDVLVFMAPEVGLEPTTLRLTAECSAIELLRNILDPPVQMSPSLL